MLFVLWTSKTHGKNSRPQKVKIQKHSGMTASQGHFCLFKLTEEFLTVRGDYIDPQEQFFIYRDKSPLKADTVHAALKKIIKNLNLDPNLFEVHGFRAGRASDLLKAGYPVEQIKIIGRWKSNAVYRYLHF